MVLHQQGSKQGGVHASIRSPRFLSRANLRVFSFLIVLLMLVFSLAFLAYSLLMNPVTVRTLPVSFRFGSVLGLTAGSEKLYFGTLTPDTAASKTVAVSASFPARVHLSAYGNGSEFIHFSENDFLIVPGMSKEISVIVIFPPSMNISGGNLDYSAVVEFRFAHENLIVES